MKALFVSDVHYEHEPHHGVDQSGAFQWLLEVVERHRPEVVLSAGDWGHAVTREQLCELTSMARVYTVYGNHDNLEALESTVNVDGSPILLRDGSVVDIGGVRLGGVNGIVALRRLMRKGVPRKRPEEFIEAARSLKGRVDVLLMHETPLLSVYMGRVRVTPASRAALDAVREARPKLVLNGHLHGDYTLLGDVEGAAYLRVDSSQASRHYGLIDLSRGVIEVWRDGVVVDRLSLNRPLSTPTNVPSLMDQPQVP